MMSAQSSPGSSRERSRSEAIASRSAWSRIKTRREGVAGEWVKRREDGAEVAVEAFRHLPKLPDRNVPSLEVSVEQVHRT